MSQCKNFLGKRTKISSLEKIAEDLDPQRSTEIYRMVLDVSKEWGDSYKPGQFIMLRPEDIGERIPLTVTNVSPMTIWSSLVVTELLNLPKYFGSGA